MHFYLVLSRKNATVVIKIFSIICFAADTHGLDKVSMERRSLELVLYLITTSENNFSEIHIS